MTASLERGFSFMSELERYDAFLRLYRSEAEEDRAALARLYRSPDPLVPLILLRYLEDIPEKTAVLAIIELIERGGEVVGRAAMAAYRRSHHPGKARVLKQLILSRDPAACRFAVRSLSRAGFMEILPLLLRELPDREPEVRLEMIDALRFLPDRRSVPVLVPLASSPDEQTRVRALQALVELQARMKVLPLDFFLDKTHDESERVRAAALEALERFPTDKVIPLLLAAAQDPSQDARARARAVRALARFPAPGIVRPLVALAESSGSVALRLAAEVALRRCPRALLRRELLPLLEEAALRRQAAVFLAELLGDEPDARARLFALWRSADPVEAAELVEALRPLGGADTARLLADAALTTGPAGYAAAAVLARVQGRDFEEATLALLEDPALPGPSRQPLLARWARRAPEPSKRDRVFQVMAAALRSSVTNERYLALHALAWFPLSLTLAPTLDLLAAEQEPDLARAASRVLHKSLGTDPLPLVDAVARHPRREALLGHVVRLLASQVWDEDKVGPLLYALRAPPLSLLERRPETFFAVCAHFIGQGALSIEAVWSLAEECRRRLFLELLASFVASRHRRFPALPLRFLQDQVGGAEAATRRVFYDLLAADGGDEALAWLAGALARENDPEVRRHGAARLRKTMSEAPR